MQSREGQFESSVTRP
nr:unnamed protein product [Callosobruchus chinensis]CAH7731558.1 unnamed protein product [Callosobruchus chinensis]CAH7752295.1 unnamed protein product [Callosobruchus chinensis]CAH7758710.1 unnamed protein product [Callosobruchus chinensis]CAH7759159.1 unnamed protein product [Callosobruchus chinensis]